jgi:phosphate:Na+ symporter
VLRDLRRIHSHICSVAYPVLDAAGELASETTALQAAPETQPLPRYR